MSTMSLCGGGAAASFAAIWRIVQWLSVIFAFAAAAVGVLHFFFAKRQAKRSFLERLQQACAEVHAVKHPLWRSSSEEFRTPSERRLPLSKLWPLIPGAEASASPETLKLLHRFVELCEGPMPEGDDKFKEYRGEYKEVVHKLEAAIGKFAGTELEEL